MIQSISAHASDPSCAVRLRRHNLAQPHQVGVPTPADVHVPRVSLRVRLVPACAERSRNALCSQIFLVHVCPEPVLANDREQFEFKSQKIGVQKRGSFSHRCIACHTSSSRREIASSYSIEPLSAAHIHDTFAAALSFVATAAAAGSAAGSGAEEGAAAAAEWAARGGCCCRRTGETALAATGKLVPSIAAAAAAAAASAAGPCAAPAATPTVRVGSVGRSRSPARLSARLESEVPTVAPTTPSFFSTLPQIR